MCPSGVSYRLVSKILAPLIGIVLVAVVLNHGSTSVKPVQAQDGPDRTIWVNVDVTSYDWWLVYWANNTIACQFSIIHEGAPTANEIQSTCGNSVYQAWLNTPPCNTGENELKTSSCEGLYLQHSVMQETSKEIQIELPAPEIWITITGNLVDSTKNKWAGEPHLLLIGEEKLANESIVRINGTYNGNSFSCEGSECSLPLATTGEQGVTMTFWGESSYGDSTEEYTAYVRVLPWADQSSDGTNNPERIGYYVDVISPQWRGQQNSSCAAIWQSFPSVDGPPKWLDTPVDASGLSSSLSLHFLAAMLIQNGEVDASDCPGGGLDYPTAANLCGVEKAQESLTAWQNQFDEEIMLTSSETGIPAQLLKNIFSRESQLWPGIYHNIEEVGLGQLTEDGAEAALLWNPDFYTQFCPLVLFEKTCANGYGNLTLDQQSTLRGALVQKVNATCSDCPMGIDLTQANFSVHIFGETLLGNCAQVDRMIYNLTNQSSGAMSSYNDLWRFTLINYNAGPGCLWNAMSRTWKAGDPLDWVHVAANLDQVCRLSVNYVMDISEGDTARIPVYSTLIPTATPTKTRVPPTARPTSTPKITKTPTSGTITVTSTVTLTPTPSSTPTPTATQSNGW